MNDLSVEVKAKEIHEKATSYYNVSQEYGYKFLMEVKKIRDERLFEHLGFSTFVSYCLSSWGYEHDYMNERIRMADEFKEEYDGYSRSLGHKKTLLLARMPEPQREKTLTEGIPTEQGYKTYDEATQKEIADYKRNVGEMERKAKEYEQQLKQRDELIASREKENKLLQSKLEDAENKEPEVIERYSEPDDYQEVKEKLKQAMAEKEEYRQQLSDWHMSHREREEKSRKYDELNEAIKEMDSKLSDGQLRFKNRKFVNDLVTQSRVLMKEVAPLTYSIESLHPDDLDKMKKSLNDLAGDLYKISKDIKEKIDEGIVVNEWVGLN